MHPAQPSIVVKHPYPLPKAHKDEQGQVVREENSAKRTGDDFRIPVFKDPI